MSNLPQPIAIVTGATGGIGACTALRLSKKGWRLWLHYNKNQKKAEELSQKISESGGSSLIWTHDLSDPTGLEDKLDELHKKENSPEISVLVNNAGIHEDTLFGMMSLGSFERVVSTNLTSAFVLMKWASRKMMRQRRGSIVNVSSLAGQTGNPGQANYAASKAGLIALTKTLAMELGSRQVRVNAVAPGFIETDMIETVPQIESFKSRIPLGRFGKPEEVAACIAFLCSEDAAYITGHTLSINGGLYPS